MTRASAKAVLAALAVLAYAPAAFAIAPGVLCELSGLQGESMACPVGLVKSTAGAPAAHALQVQLSYPTSLQFTHVSTCEACPAIVPPGQPWTGPHTLNLAPTTPAAWTGGGQLSLVDPTGTSNPLSTAHYVGGTLVGNPNVIWVHFNLTQGIPAGQPALVAVVKAVLSGPSAQPMPSVVFDGTIFGSAPVGCTVSGVACDDGNACTTGDTCLGGSCAGAPTVECSDGNFCNGFEWCDVGSGCQPGTDGTCNDGSVCTVESCQAAAGCRTTGSLDCNDGIACTADACNPTLGCTNTPNDALCDDGNACTADACTPGGCEHTPLFCYEPNKPTNVVCTTGGAVGQTVTCQIRLARDQFTSPKPVSLQLPLVYGSGLELQYFRACPTCFAIPPASSTLTGHSVVLAPASPSSWAGWGTVALLNVASPDTSVSEAYLDSGSTVGNSLILEAIFERVTADAGDAYSTWVWTSGAAAGGPGAVPLSVGVVDQTIVVSPFGTVCATPGTPCNDGNACTSNDVCVAGACVGTAINCSNGNYCDGVESCDPALGCLPGPDPNCNDGNACTVDACHATAGCMNTGSTNCDDGNPCTTDTCSPATGCSNAANPALCNDSDPCTADSCLAGQGCQHQPLFCYAPGAPDDAICSLTGAAGAQIDCTIRLARRQSTQQNATSAQFDLQIPAGASVVSLRECPSCGTIPPASILSTGHQAILAPSSPASWTTQGSVLLLDPAGGSMPLTTAHKDGGVVTGDSELLIVRLQLLAQATNPLYVRATGISAGGPSASPLSAAVEGGVIITDSYAVTCPMNGAACNDGNACTENDTCVAGVCVGNPLTCDDGNPCNGLENCFPTSGCVAGPPANCEDGNLCTTQTCGLAGCAISGATNCDDADVCTTDGCVPATGCTNVVLPSTCDDGDACTADVCISGQGCEHTPLACYPPPPPVNTLCTVQGAAGTTAECHIRIARSSQPESGAVSAQLALSWPAGISLIDFRPCDGCVGSIPPMTTASSGHQVILSPTSPASWNMGGQLAALHFSDAFATMTNAWMNAGAVQGNATFVVARLSLDADFTGTPAHIMLASGALTTTGAVPLGWTVDGGVIVTNILPPCGNPGGACNDGNACTIGDTCLAGTCVGTTNPCNDGNFCNGVETCNPATGCVAGAVPNCDDGDACTIDDCDGLLGCDSSTPVDCNDSNDCTADSCNPATGCDNIIPPGTCDDGDPCTGDSCDQALGCLYTPLFCYDPNLAGAVCLLSGAAGSTVSCDIRLARASASEPEPVGLQVRVVYPAGDATLQQFTACHACVDAVPPALLPEAHQVFLSPSSPPAFGGNGQVAILPGFGAPNAALSDAYLDGIVMGDPSILVAWFTLPHDVSPSAPVPVHLSNALATGAGGVPLATAVQDGIIVVGAHSVDCATNGAACDDGDPCSIGDVCVAGVCVGQPKDCDDGSFCNGIEFCLPATGDCEAGPAPDCDDGNACTTASCTNSGCIQAPVSCADGDECTVEDCNPSSGCTFAAANCDDGDPCTADSCNSLLGCQHQPLACFELTENVVCELSGLAGTTATCSLRLARSLASPDAAATLQLRLQYAPTWATLTSFAASAGGPAIPPASALDSGHSLLLNGLPVSWNGSVDGVVIDLDTPDAAITSATWDGNAVMGDAEFAVARFTLLQDVDPAHPLVVVAKPITATGPGAEALLATVIDMTIITGPAPDCAAIGGACDDGNACTANDICVAGGCVGVPVTCGDGNFCTGLDTCDPLTGCATTPPPSCDDGDACTVDACHPLFGCLPPSATACDDGNDCTDDSCSPATGCSYANNNGTCDDAASCTAGGVCVAGVCVSLGGQADCDDNSACTTDTCDDILGCVFTPIVCNDGIPCTTDSCNPTSGCVAISNSAACNDSNPCTTDFCHPLVGCVHGSLTTACNDGNACTFNDTCSGGVCAGTPDPLTGELCDGDDVDDCEDGRIDCVDEQTGVGCINTGPVGFWEFDGNLNDTAPDASGEGLDGVLFGDAQLIGGGVFGGALRTFGSSGRMQAMLDMPERNFTIAMWFRTSAANGTLFAAAAGGNLAQGGSDRRIFVRSGKLGFSIQTAGGTVECAGQGPTVTTGTWRHVAVSCDAYVGCTLYHNASAICTTPPTASMSTFTAADRILLGYSPADGFYSGSLDRVAVFEYPMTNAELSSFLAGGPVDPGSGLNLELCDGEDNNCDGSIDDGCACLFAGDLNGDGATDVVDAQCSVLVSLAELVNGPPPACLIGPKTVADLNCSNTVTVVDVQILIRIALNLPLVPDVNNNQCIDTCEPDLN